MLLFNQRRLSKTFAEVSNSVAAIVDMNNQIASAVEEQRTTSIDINKNINSISNISTENTIGSTKTASASIELADLASVLKRLVAEFKI